jgi:PTS system mannose-specific IIA component
MIGVLIITHGKLGQSLVECVSHVLGARPPQFDFFPVGASDDPVAVLPKARETLDRLDSGAGVLIFSDIYGATPCNLACKLLVPGRVEVIAGVNLPMLIRAFTYRTRDLDTMVKKAVSGGCEGVMHIGASPVYAAARA